MKLSLKNENSVKSNENCLKKRDEILAHCWCDADANASFSQGKLNPSYVVEIYIHPWDPLDARNRKLFKVFHINDIMHKKESAPDCFKKARVNFCLRSHI